MRSTLVEHENNCVVFTSLHVDRDVFRKKEQVRVVTSSFIVIQSLTCEVDIGTLLFVNARYAKGFVRLSVETIGWCLAANIKEYSVSGEVLNPMILYYCTLVCGCCR